MYERIKAHLAKVSLALLSAAFLLGCQEQGSELVGPESPQFHGGAGNCNGHHKNDQGCPGTTDPDGGDLMFDVTIRTVEGPVWTGDPPPRVPDVGSSWLHLSDQGHGTRGRAKYPGAFRTMIFLQPANDASCVNEDNVTTTNPLLFGKLKTTEFLNTVFDFQVGYSNLHLQFFLFRWEDSDGTFSASIGPFPAGDSERPSVEFSGDDDTDNDPDLVDDPTKTRVFRISGGKVIAHELDKNQVIATLACNNEHVIEVTVAPVTS